MDLLAERAAGTLPRGGSEAMVRRRRVVYVEGYDPQGAKGYHRLFLREWRRFLTVWPLQASVGDLVIESEAFAHWRLSAAAPGWKVETQYDFLRLEHVIRPWMAAPTWAHLWRSLRWIADDLTSLTFFRIFRASWRFGLHLLYPQLFILAWIAASVLAGAAAGRWLAAAALPWPLALTAGAAVAFLVGLAIRKVADRGFVIQISGGWPHLRAFARGRPTGFDAAVEAGAQRIVDAARDDACDEVLILAHSAGTVLAPLVLARALAIDPDLGRRGPRVVLMTLGAIMPGFALHPAARRLREALARVAQEPSITWIDCQSRKDIMNFWDFDPIEDVGVRLAGARVNPQIWTIRFRDMVSPQYYPRIRTNFFRLHFQFIMGNDRRAPYDFFMLVAGPVPAAEWPRQGHALVAAFDADAAYPSREKQAPAA